MLNQHFLLYILYLGDAINGKYDITSMSCAACSFRVEKAVSKLDNVQSCSVNLLTNSMTVIGSVSAEKVIEAVVNAGYGASVHDNSAKPKSFSPKQDTQ